MHPSEHAPIRFPSQRPNEHVILLIRPHWTVVLGFVSQLIIFLLIPPIILFFLLYFTTFSFVPNTLSFVLTIQAISLYYLFCFLTYFHDFVDYHLDVWIITDQRIISIEQQGLFQRIISEVSIFRIQDVTSEVRGKLQTILDYGDVYIQTAGQQERFDFERIGHPAEIARIILHTNERAMKERERREMQEEIFYQQQYAKQQGVNPAAMPQSPLPGSGRHYRRQHEDVEGL